MATRRAGPVMVLSGDSVSVKEVDNRSQVFQAMKFRDRDLQLEFLERIHNNLDSIDRVGAEIGQVIVNGDVIGANIRQDA
jgi:hypothetical protein